MYLWNVGHRLFTISQTELNSKTMCKLQTTAFFYWAWKCTLPRNLRRKRRARKLDTRNLGAKREYTYTYLTSWLTYCAYCLRNGTVRSGFWCEYLKKTISCGRNVLLHGKFVEVKIWYTLVEVLAKNKLVRCAHSCVLKPNLNSSAPNLNLHS